MAESQRPTAEELDALVDRVRRDPAAYRELGDAYLALGRPRDALEIGARGLKADPDDLAGRVMVARAFAQLHQWKEAQVELLKVVKADRNHGAAFRLLGEVLMRRSDFDRALPVLQHAQNLLPADPSILNLLKRARTGQPLDPPDPIPTPIAPASGGRRAQRGPVETIDGEEPVLGRVALEQREVMREGPRAPVDRNARKVDDRGRHQEERRPVEVHRPPPIEDPFAPLGGGSIAGGPAVGSSTISQHGSIRPRLMPIEKPKDAAQASLRRSVAVGEDYLNNLLVGGLLDVPRVRVSQASYDVSPDRRWGRSIGRMFVYLFVLLFLAVGGGGAWYWYSEKQRAEDVGRYLATATTDIDSGDYEGLIAADTAARAAIERDRSNAYAVAVLAEISGLETLLYRDLDPAEVEKAIALAAEDIQRPDDEGYRELVVARAAVGLASLSPDDEGSDRRLADVRAELDAYLTANPDDFLVRWLSGEALAAAGARAAAEAAFEQAHAGGKGSVLGTIALAQSQLDAGKYDEARALYDGALARSPKHPWAFLGRSLGRSERSVELEEAMSDLSIGVSQAAGARVMAFKHLGLATAHLGLEDYGGFTRELDQATGVEEPRFLARVGLLRVAQGKIAAAAAARAKVRWYAPQPEPDPLIQLLDAELLLARGLPAAALEQVGAQAGVRAARLRGLARLDLGEAAAASKELAAALAIAPDDLETRTWAESARLIAGRGDEQRKADEALDSLGRRSKSKAARLAHGLSLMRIGRTADARTRLEQSVTDVSEEYPNPLAYRSHVALGELDLAAGQTAAGMKQVEKALEQNPGYLPAHDLAGRLLVGSDRAKALPHLVDVINANVATAGAELAYIRAVMPSDAADVQASAIEALKRAKQKGASTEAMQAVHDLMPDAFDKLGIPSPRPAAPPPKKSRGRRR